MGRAAGPAATDPDGPDRRILVFAKEPVPGEVKTRLSTGLGEATAARLYRAFLDDVVASVRRCRGASTELWVTPGEAVPWFSDRYPDLPVRPQAGKGLGERLEGAFSDVFQSGAGEAVAVGSDHPTLPGEFVSRGFRVLAGTDVVLGPSVDGGYYLVGIRARAWPAAREIFAGIPWSTDRVLRVTRSRVRRLGLTCELLPDWYDVDDPSDLPRLRTDVEESSQTARILGALTTLSAHGE